MPMYPQVSWSFILQPPELSAAQVSMMFYLYSVAILTTQLGSSIFHSQSDLIALWVRKLNPLSSIYVVSNYGAIQLSWFLPSS